MSQETRKDKRAPVSLRVRFKSATIDEFIEQYSIDISKGGIFIKSRQPMAVGTLLKFEFQLKDNSPLIQGVGRVVWKRDADPAKPDLAAGMGIKFIKMTPESRAVVDRIVGDRDNGDDDEPPQATPQDDSTRVANVADVMARAEAVAAAAPAPEPAKPAAPAPPLARPPAPAHEPKADEGPLNLAALTEEFAAPPEAAPAGSAGSQEEKTLTAVGVPGRQVAAPAEAASPGPRGEAAIAQALKGVRASDPTPQPAALPLSPAPTAQPVATAVAAAAATPDKKSGGAGMIVVVLLVLAALGGGAYWWFFLRGGAGPSDGTDGSGTEPIAAVTDAGHGAPADAGHAKVAAADAGGPATASPAATATLKVASDPQAATVFVDDVEKGVTPLETPVVPGTAVRVRVQLAGYEPFTQEVTPGEGTTEVNARRLRELPRFIVVRSTPEGADVYVGDRRRGKTPAKIDVRRLNDAVEVRVEQRGHAPFTVSVGPTEGWRESEGEYVFEVDATLVAQAPDEPRGPRGPRGPRTAEPGPQTAAPPQTTAPQTATPPPQTAAPRTAAPPPRTAAPPPQTAAPPRSAIPDNPFG